MASAMPSRYWSVKARPNSVMPHGRPLAMKALGTATAA